MPPVYRFWISPYSDEDFALHDPDMGVNIADVICSV
jgi:hypothetical protein